MHKRSQWLGSALGLVMTACGTEAPAVVAGTGPMAAESPAATMGAAGSVDSSPPAADQSAGSASPTTGDGALATPTPLGTEAAANGGAANGGAPGTDLPGAESAENPTTAAGAAASPATPVSTPIGSTAPADYDYSDEAVDLSADLVIPAGQTLRVGPSTTFNASTNVSIRVEGELIVAGTAAAPVRFLGAGVPRSWHGIEVEAGGKVTMSQFELGGATYGIHAKPGSAFAIDHADLGTSFKAAVLQSEGTIDSTRFHASSDPTFSAVNEVSIDDVNGTLTIIDASPTVTNSRFDGGFSLVDMIRVGGQSAPTFDRLHITDAHCGIHSFGVANNGLTVTNSIFEGLAYGMMIYNTAPTVKDSVFAMNATDIGFCFDATQDQRPALSNNFYSSGELIVDPTCFQIGATDSSPASSASADAGPQGL